MNRWLPFVVSVLIVAGFIAALAPGIYRSMLFKRDCRAMLTAVSSGNLVSAITHVDAQQQATVSALFTATIPRDYEQYIASLKLTSWEQQKSGEIWAIVTLRIEDGTNLGLYQGKLLWTYDASTKCWWWDVGGSFGAEYSTSGEPRWQPLATVLQLAGEF